MAAVDESADIAGTAPATAAGAASPHSSRPDAGGARSEWNGRLALAGARWAAREGEIVYTSCRGALFPIILNPLHGVEQTPEVLVRAAQSLGASRMCIFRHVVLPGALPSICAGLAIGMGVSWFSLLAGEIISGQYGIGYFIWNAYSMTNTPDIIVGMLNIWLFGAATTLLVQWLTRPALAW